MGSAGAASWCPIPWGLHSCPSRAAFVAAAAGPGADLPWGNRHEDTDSPARVARVASSFSRAPSRYRICPVPAWGRVRPRVCGKMLFFPPLDCP